MKSEQEIKGKYEELAAIVRDERSDQNLKDEALGACDALLWVQEKAEGMLGSLIGQATMNKEG